MASPWNQHCANCIGILRFQYLVSDPRALVSIDTARNPHSMQSRVYMKRSSVLPFPQILPTAALHFFFLNIHYMDSPDCLLLFLSVSIFYF